jgi:hypothetical protein
MRLRRLLSCSPAVAIVLALAPAADSQATATARRPATLSVAGYAALRALGTGPCSALPIADRQSHLLAQACGLDGDESRAARKLVTCDTLRTYAAARSCLFSSVGAIRHDERGDARVDDVFRQLLAPGRCVTLLTVGRSANVVVAGAATRFVAALEGSDGAALGRAARALGAALSNEARVEGGTTPASLRIACRPRGS